MKRNLIKLLAGHIQTKSKDRTENGRTYCPYTARCGKDCSNDVDCQVKRFYDRYPQYQEMSIGSRI